MNYFLFFKTIDLLVHGVLEPIVLNGEHLLKTRRLHVLPNVHPDVVREARGRPSDHPVGGGVLHVVQLAAAVALGGLGAPGGRAEEVAEVGLQLREVNREETGEGRRILKTK